MRGPNFIVYAPPVLVKQIMSGGASEKAATMIVLLLTVALLPMLVENFMNYERKRQEEDYHGTKRKAIIQK